MYAYFLATGTVLDWQAFSLSILSKEPSVNPENTFTEQYIHDRAL